jgi:signal transduction histidine kinase
VIRDGSDCTGTRDSLYKLRDEFEQRVVDRTSAQSAAVRKQATRTQDNETFVYSVSHDLRAPLINLQGFSEELGAAVIEAQSILSNSQQAVPPRLQQLLDEDMPESIHFLRTAATRLGIIIDALLRVSRSGCVEYQRVAVDLGAVVARVTDSLSSTARDLGASVITRELPSVIGDPTAIDLIFANLLSNALNYLDPEREGLIEIGTQNELASEPTGDTPATWTLYVKDNGRGIPADSVEKVFQIFQRLHPDSSVGEGIGLTIVRRIIERHGGRIWFESVEGQGTTFFVTLPAA